MTMQKLIKNWSLPDRTQERTQLTLRLDFDSYARLHALKEVYKTRSVNDMINDILKTGLDEIVEALPKYKMTSEECIHEAYLCADGTEPQDLVDVDTGPGVVFEWAYKRILETKAPEETETKKLEVVS